MTIELQSLRRSHYIIVGNIQYQILDKINLRIHSLVCSEIFAVLVIIDQEIKNGLQHST
jgi:hypothetical protein